MLSKLNDQLGESGFRLRELKTSATGILFSFCRNYRYILHCSRQTTDKSFQKNVVNAVGSVTSKQHWKPRIKRHLQVIQGPQTIATNFRDAQASLGYSNRCLCCVACPPTSIVCNIDWPVHYWMLCINKLHRHLPLWRLPSAVPCSTIFGSVPWQQTWPNHDNLQCELSTISTDCKLY